MRALIHWCVLVHCRWIDLVAHRMDIRRASLASILVRWGRYDVAKRVFSNPELIDQRSESMLQPAFQEAVQRALSERDFNVQLLDLLKSHGARASECDLARCFEMATEDPFLLLSEIRDLQDVFYRDNQEKLRGKRQERPTGGATGAVTSPNESLPPRPSQIGLPEYSQAFPVRAASQRPEEVLRSYPVHGCSPWHKAHVQIIGRHIGNFSVYARSQRHTSFFDLMLSAICCGAIDLAHTLWTHCDSPLRSALIAIYFVEQMERRRRGTPEQLKEMRKKFQQSAIGVLEALARAEDRRHVLIAVPKASRRSVYSRKAVSLLGPVPPKRFFTWMGDWLPLPLRQETPSEDASPQSILDLATSLENRAFISHPYCQAVLQELWRGRSALCGKVCCSERPKVSHMFWQVLYAILMVPTILLIPMVPKKLPIKANDQYEWTSFTRTGEPQFYIHPLETLRNFMFIPLVKQMLFCVFHFFFILLFMAVAFQPLCGALNVWHYIFGYCLAANVVHIAFHLLLASSSVRRQWWGSWLSFHELVYSLLLVVAAVLRVCLTTAARICSACACPRFGMRGMRLPSMRAISRLAPSAVTTMAAATGRSQASSSESS